VKPVGAIEMAAAQIGGSAFMFIDRATMASSDEKQDLPTFALAKRSNPRPERLAFGQISKGNRTGNHRNPTGV
jgi:hypothetical protein